MGADMLLTCVPKFNPTGARVEQLREAISSSSCIKSGEHFYSDDLDEWKDYMLSAIDDVTYFDSNRDVTVMSVEGGKYPVWITGGISWGGDPTEVFYSMCALEDCEPIWTMIRAWAIEDHPSDKQQCISPTQDVGEPSEKELRRRRDEQLKRSLGF
jgi:hypothetical protein